MNEFLSNPRNRIALAAVAVVIVLAGGGGYYVWSQNKSDLKVASLADSGLCKATVALARDYGVLPPDAQKVGEKAISDSDPNRITCNAQADSAKFTLIADVPCDDAKDDKCLQLQKVTASDGKALYDAQNI